MSETVPAYFFENEADGLGAVVLTQSATGLPPPSCGSWELRAKFRLGVHYPTPMGLDPEPILRGLVARGYFMWGRERIIPFGTSQ